MKHLAGYRAWAFISRTQSTQFGAQGENCKICKGIFGRRRRGRRDWRERVRLRLREGERSREREREREETDFGCKGCSQNAAFQVRIFTIFFPLLAVSRTRTTRARQANLRVRAFLFMVNCVITP